MISLSRACKYFAELYLNKRMILIKCNKRKISKTNWLEKNVTSLIWLCNVELVNKNLQLICRISTWKKKRQQGWVEDVQITFLHEPYNIFQLLYNHQAKMYIWVGFCTLSDLPKVKNNQEFESSWSAPISQTV